MSILKVTDNVEYKNHHEILNTYFSNHLEKSYDLYLPGWKIINEKFAVWFPYFEYKKGDSTIKGSKKSLYYNSINNDGTEITEYCKELSAEYFPKNIPYRIVFGAKHGENYRFLGVFKSAEVNETGYNYLYRIHKRVTTFIDVSVLDESSFDNSIIEDVRQILTIPNLKETERKVFGKIRIGQGIFRENMLSKYKCRCAICGLGVKDLLVSSHIKEWFESNDKEKVDHENGLLLCAMHDALFDKHLISFNQDGKICISKHLTEPEKLLCNINENIFISMSDKTKEYMKFHYDKFLKQEKSFQQ